MAFETLPTPAASRLGAISNPLIPIYREREGSFMVGLVKSKVIVVPKDCRGFDYPTMVDLLRPAWPDLAHVLAVDDPSWTAFLTLAPKPDDAARARLAALRPDPNEVTLLIFTSGTTGEPKGVMHTHNTMVAHDLLNANNLGERDLSTLNLFCCMGAPIPRVMVRHAKQVLPGMTVLGGWGQSENGLVTLGVPGDADEKIIETDGYPWPGTRIRVVDFEGKELPPDTTPDGASRDREGRLEVTGPFLPVGYAERPEMSRTSFDGEWFDTGDLARIDADGYLKIVGWTRDVIIRGGVNIPVANVKNVLYEHPALDQVAVVAVPDLRLQERAGACVVLAPGTHGFTLEDLRALLAERGVAKQYWPERVEVLAEFPKTPSGKIQKFALRKKLAEALP